MNLPTITMERSEARKVYAEYRQAVKDRHLAEDEALLAGYRELSRGHPLIALHEAMRSAGVDSAGYPKLAAIRADATVCYVSIRNDGGATFSMDRWPDGRATRRRVRLASGTFPSLPGQYREERVTAVPLVPWSLRPRGGLERYHVLFEVERWAKAPLPPGDPALLRHLRGDLYVVLGTWDLTALERAIILER